MMEDAATEPAMAALQPMLRPGYPYLGQHNGGLETPSSSSARVSGRLTPDSDSGDNVISEYAEAYELRRLGAAGARSSVASLSSTSGDEEAVRGSEPGEGAGRERRIGAGTTGRFETYTPDEEQAVVRKFDRKLVMFLALLYMLSFLDRSNIGNARIAGMDDDLQSGRRRDDWYEWALTAFYVTYIAFEWMAMLWRLIPAHIFVSAIVLSWGLTASLQAIAVNYPMLIFLRALLGMGEAAFTGVPFYLSFFFKRHELAFRTAMFISAAPLATSFASGLAWVITKLGGSGPIAPWRLLFLLEGFPSVVLAAVAWDLIPDSPQTAAYLSPREKEIARLRLRLERPSAASTSTSTARDVLSTLADPVAWLTAAIFFLTNTAYASLPVFLPTVLAAMGHSAAAAQALAAPPQLAAFPAVLLAARASDRARSRGPLLAAAALLSAAGYAALALLPAATPGGGGGGGWWRYAAVFPAAAGVFPAAALAVAWALNNQASEARRGAALALVQVVGQCGPLLAARLYPAADAPRYAAGMAACAAAMLAAAALAGMLRWRLARLNAALDGAEAEVRRRGEAEGLVGGAGAAAGEGGGFRYML